MLKQYTIYGVILFVTGYILFQQVFPVLANTPYIKEAFLKVEDTQVRSYLIKVQHVNPEKDGEDYEYSVNLENGKLYVNPLPGHVKATITIIPNSKDYRAKNIYSITNAEHQKIFYFPPSKKGYFATHKFDLEPTGTHLDPSEETLIQNKTQERVPDCRKSKHLKPFIEDCYINE